MSPTFLAAMIVSRQVFEALEGHLRNLDPISQAIVSGIENYYQRDSSAQYVDPDILEQLVCGQINSDKHKQEISAILTVVRDLAPNVSDVNVRELARSWKRTALGRELATKLASSQHGEVSGLMEQYITLCGEEEKEERLSFDDIFGELEDPKTAMPLGPKAFNDMLDGGARGGDHICIFGRSNAGKSLVSIDFSCRLATLGKRGIYLENEDRLKRTTRRFWTNLTGMTKEEILSNKKKARQIADQMGINNIVIQDINPGTVGQITGMVRTYKPDFIVVNQIRNLSLGGASSMTEKLERAAIGMRNLCKKENILVISVTQAGDSATNKLVLDQSDIDNSKTGLPSQMDLMVGVGVNDECESNNTRVLSTCKNKLSGDNGHVVVKIDKRLSKIITE